MTFDAKLLDARGNEFQGALDPITGQTVTDARAATAVLSAANAESVMDLNGQAVAVFDVRTAAANMTLVFEGSIDGVNYFGLSALIISTTLASPFVAESMVSGIIITTTHTGLYVVGCSGLRRIRIRESAHTSGTVTVGLRASQSDFAIYARPIPSILAVQIDGAANTIATITLPAVVGLFHYITSISWYRHCTAALVGTGAFNITTTNLPGTMKWRIGNAIAVGENRIDVGFQPANPVKSLTANTATTIVAAAAGAAVLTTGLCTYYVGA